jgi:haloalkane dehalogenase
MADMIERRFIDIGARRVHYRVCGSGPPVLLVHQSPRSSAEYARLMREWGRHFTLIAPDSPGFGQSTPLALDQPEVEDFADAAVSVLDALGIAQAGAYGYHSGAITLVTAAKRHPHRFSALAANGYAVWNDADRTILDERYLPPLIPTAYGEHLVWLWNRILEQTWFFPWYDARDAARLTFATDDPAAIQPIVLEMLESGDHYRRGYGAMLRANRDLPAPGAPSPPTAIVASKPDPLGAHISRLGALPPGWSATLFDTPPQAEAAALAHLLAHPAPTLSAPLAQAADEGFVRVAGVELHWRQVGGRDSVRLPDLGSSLRALGRVEGVALDLPGHGLSDAWDAPSLPALADLLAEAIRPLAHPAPTVIGHGWSALIAPMVAARLGGRAEGEGTHLPHPADAPAHAAATPCFATPQRAGEHLVAGWAHARARLFYWPAHRATRANAITFDPADVTPERLREAHLALAQARGAAHIRSLLAGADWPALLAERLPVQWRMAEWARARADIWKP